MTTSKTGTTRSGMLPRSADTVAQGTSTMPYDRWPGMPTIASLKLTDQKSANISRLQGFRDVA